MCKEKMNDKEYRFVHWVGIGNKLGRGALIMLIVCDLQEV
jgi:hypothetical protein